MRKRRQDYYRNLLILSFALSIFGSSVAQSPSTVKEQQKRYRTYPFSDPDPVANEGKIYPYFRYDGFTDKAIEKQWKVVELENDYIKLQIMPEIGGKIWTAIDKQNGRPFIYDNDVVKFRDVAMRGPWTSGGIEANFGILGHTPAVATPVDYLTRTNEDGSASCIISVLDLLTGSRWSMEIRLPKDKAYFITRVYWHNTTPVWQAYYSWMNLAEKVRDSLAYLDPGTHYIGHDGSVHAWPEDTLNHRDLSIYAQNNFGPSKSYHVLGTYSKYYGAYWQKDDYGMIHFADREDKLGKKVWIWSLSGQGMIWKDQLSDHSGQYTEIQSGRLFSQNALISSLTPFKQVAFAPYQSDRWSEYWYPFSHTGGVSDADLNGVMHVEGVGDSLKISFSAVAMVQDTLQLKREDGQVVFQAPLQLKPLQRYHRTIAMPQDKKVYALWLAGHKIPVTQDTTASLDRPLKPFRGFDWGSAYGLYLMGRDEALYHDYEDAERRIRASLGKDPSFMPALTQMSQLQYRKMQYDSAYYYARIALSVDTYDPNANYDYGVAAEQLGKIYDALDGFEIATLTTPLRSAAFAEMSRVYLQKGNYTKAYHYAASSLNSDQHNMTALRLQYLAARLMGDLPHEKVVAQEILKLEPLNHFIRFEAYRAHKDSLTRQAFTRSIRNELPAETYLDLAIWYDDLHRDDESLAVLNMAPANNLVDYWRAFLLKDSGGTSQRLATADQGNPLMVFPFRAETAKVMAWAIQHTGDWKPRYYLALLLSDRNREKAARALLEGVSGKIDFAPFFVTRARLRDSADTDGKRDDFLQAAALDPKAWRYRKYLAAFYLSRHEPEKALPVVERYFKDHPDNYIIGMLYTRCLMLNDRYKEAEKVLRDIQILPYEGTTNGRKLYEQTKLMLALQALEKGRYKAALTKVKEAGDWPVNLGVGKPYPGLINTDQEDSLRSLIHESMGKKGRAEVDYGACKRRIESISGSGE